MESDQKNITSHAAKKTLEIETVIDLLVLFSRIWFLEGKPWKAIKALFSAGRLRLDRIYYGQRVVLLSKRMGAKGLENEAEFTQLARSIFADLTKFQFSPFVQRTVDEMVNDANSLFSYYMLKKRRNDVAGTTRN